MKFDTRQHIVKFYSCLESWMHLSMIKCDVAFILIFSFVNFLFIVLDSGYFNCFLVVLCHMRCFAFHQKKEENVANYFILLQRTGFLQDVTFHF